MNRISSPEELDCYLKVTGSQIWLTLTAIIVLLAGMFAWMVFRRLDTVEKVAIISSEGKTVCLVPAEKRDAFIKCGVVKVPVIMQLEVTECGAASLAMILAYFNKWVPLERTRQDCGVIP